MSQTFITRLISRTRDVIRLDDENHHNAFGGEQTREQHHRCNVRHFAIVRNAKNWAWCPHVIFAYNLPTESDFN